MSFRNLAACAAWMGACAVSCAGQKLEPQLASSAAQANYANDFPQALQSVSNDYVNSEGDVRKITTDFPKFPEQLKDPPWPLVQTIVARADEAGRSASYVEAYRETQSVRSFFTEERDEIMRRVAGSAQYV